MKEEPGKPVLSRLKAWIERLQPSLRRLRPVAAVATFAESTKIEMDLRLEAALVILNHLAV